MHSPRMLDTKQAAAYLGLRPQTLHEWRCRGVGPQYAKLGRAVRYRDDWLEAYIDCRIISPNAR